jgi:hypothetical protein
MRAVDGGRGALRAAVTGGLVVLTALLVLLTGCSSGVEPTAVPTFPTPAQQGGPSGVAADGSGAIPDDCNRILGVGDLEALLGLPLASVAVRTVVGIAEPSVRRTERVSCNYTGGPVRGRALLAINASAYVDAAAAAAQWRVNSAAETGERREVPLGSASAVLVERRDEAVLLVAHNATNITLVLPDQPLPGGRSPGDVLVDIALRVLPSMSVTPASAHRVGPPDLTVAIPAATMSRRRA